MINSVSIPDRSVLSRNNHLFKYYSKIKMNFDDNKVLEVGTPVINSFLHLIFIETEGSGKRDKCDIYCHPQEMSSTHTIT